MLNNQSGRPAFLSAILMSGQLVAAMESFLAAKRTPDSSPGKHLAVGESILDLAILRESISNSDSVTLNVFGRSVASDLIRFSENPGDSGQLPAFCYVLAVTVGDKTSLLKDFGSDVVGSGLIGQSRNHEERAFRNSILAQIRDEAPKAFELLNSFAQHLVTSAQAQRNTNRKAKRAARSPAGELHA